MRTFNLRIPNKFLLAIGVLIGFTALVISMRVLLPLDDSLTRLQEGSVIRIGYAIEAPYAYIGSRGSITGESPEVASVIVEELGIDRIEWVQTDFDSLIQGLLDHRFDVIAAGMFITPGRALQVRFSNPTFRVNPGLLTHAGNPHQLQSYEDLITNPTLRVAVLAGSIEERYLTQLGISETQLITVPDAITGKTAVSADIADALALSSVTVRWMAAHDASRSVEAIEVPQIFDSPLILGYGAFAFRINDIQLINGWNQILESYIGSPAHLELIKHYGFTESELPDKTTSDSVLNP